MNNNQIPVFLFNGFLDSGKTTLIKEIIENEEAYGFVLRSKGMVQDKENAENWLYFDYVPEEPDVRLGSPSSIGKICVIGTNIDKNKIKELFGN